MTKQEAIEYLVKHSVYQDEWSGAGMWEAVQKVMARDNRPISQKYLDQLLFDAENF